MASLPSARKVDGNEVPPRKADVSSVPRLSAASKVMNGSSSNDPPFSPTHTSPTDLHHSAQAQQFAPRSSHSLYSSLGDLPSYPSNRQTQHVPLSTSPHSQNISINNGTEHFDSSTSGNMGTPPIRAVSPRLALPSIQTNFHGISKQKESPATTAGGSSIRSTATRDTPIAHKSSLYNSYDSPYTSTTMTTPSSIGLHQASRFSPLLQYGDELASSPATSGENGEMEVHIGSTDQHKYLYVDERQVKELRSRSRSLGLPSITSTMLWKRLRRSRPTNESLPLLQVHHSPPLLSSTSPSVSTAAVPSLKKQTLSSGSLVDGTNPVTEINNSRDALYFSRSEEKEEGPSFKGQELTRDPDSTNWSTSHEFGKVKAGPLSILDDQLPLEQKVSNFFPSDLRPPTSILESAFASDDHSTWVQDSDRGGESTVGEEAVLVGAAQSNSNLLIGVGSDSSLGKTEEDPPFSLRTATIPKDVRGQSQHQFDHTSTDPVLILFVTSGVSVLSSDTSSALDRIGAIHLDIPDYIIWRWWQRGSRVTSDFITLEPFVTDAMSKRRISDLLKVDDAPLSDSKISSGTTSDKKYKSYWHRDVVLINSDRYGDKSKIDEDGAISPYGPLDSESAFQFRNVAQSTLAIQAFAEAVQELSSSDDLSKGVFSLESGIEGLQTMFNFEDSSSATALPVFHRPAQTGQGHPDISNLSTSPNIDASLPSGTSIPSDKIETNAEKEASSSTSLAMEGSPVSTPSRKTRSGRPTLARLKTSDMIQTSEGSLGAKLTTEPLSTSRLALDMGLGTTRANSTNEGLSLEASAFLQVREGREDALGQRALSVGAKSIQTLETPTPATFFDSHHSTTSSFEPSEIVSNFLYLGPDITTLDEVDYLKKKWGIRRILNAADEIEDGGGKHLNLNISESSGIEKYKKIAMTDTVEAKGVQRCIEEACDFIDDAKLHSAPIYVHCKAGKSRSVLLVMAYLIHSNHWTLSQSYSYVADRRQTVSPNIGFVAELMAFEDRCLRVKRIPSSSTKLPIRSSSADEPLVTSLNPATTGELHPTNNDI